MRQDNVKMLNDTLAIFERGNYRIGNKKVLLKLSAEEIEEAQVFLPGDIERLDDGGEEAAEPAGNCTYACVNVDSFSLARKRNAQFIAGANHKKPVLVLNLANPVNPGGGVRRGAKAQEEDLCRKSSLLRSLEGPNASAYYEYNRSLHTFMGSNAVIISPQVEIIKDEEGNLLRDSVIVSVMTCAAPMLTYGMEGMTQKEYKTMVYRRITGMLKVAAYLGYEYLILGAFGCGAFHNDANIVSDLFYKAIKDFEFRGLKEKNLFRRIDFAVLDHSHKHYNFNEFSRNFNHFQREEDQAGDQPIEEREIHRDAIRGCLYGGAVGDALGYPVEFMTESAIFSMYGDQGITTLKKNPNTGKAEISDDTQMTLFTANGLLVGDTVKAIGGNEDQPRRYVAMAYQDWLKTQEDSMWGTQEHESSKDGEGCSWLLDVPELFSRRAPGMTCLSALREEKSGLTFEDYVEAKRNNSKGCGGIMRVAPIGLTEWTDIEELDMEAAQLAATLPSPLKRNPAHATPYFRKQSSVIAQRFAWGAVDLDKPRSQRRERAGEDESLVEFLFWMLKQK